MKLEFTGYEGVMNRNDRIANGLSARIEKALALARDLLVETMQCEEGGFKHPTGEMGRLIEENSRTITHGASASYVEVWPGELEYHGPRGKARRASTIDFVIEYGRRGDEMAVNPWNVRANRKVKKKIGSIIAETMNEVIT